MLTKFATLRDTSGGNSRLISEWVLPAVASHGGGLEEEEEEECRRNDSVLPLGVLRNADRYRVAREEHGPGWATKLFSGLFAEDCLFGQRAFGLKMSDTIVGLGRLFTLQCG